MLDVYELREGSFEIVDSQIHELRARRMLYYRLIRFVIVLLVIFASTFLLISYFTSNIFWSLPAIIPIGLIVFAKKQLDILRNKLSPKIASIILKYDREKNIQNFKIRRWLPVKMEEFIEEEIRYNQAIGFRITWYDDGFLDTEIIVDKEFPGTKIFETFDFLAVAELSKLLDVALPKLSVRQFRLEDGSDWEDSQINEFEEELKNARIPWIAREYFTQL